MVTINFFRKEGNKMLLSINCSVVSSIKVDLVFDDEALNEIAKLAIERNTGARGLRSIIENIMMKPMFEIPSIPNVAKVTVTKDFVIGKGDISIEYAPEQETDATPEEASKI